MDIVFRFFRPLTGIVQNGIQVFCYIWFQNQIYSEIEHRKPKAGALDERFATVNESFLYVYNANVLERSLIPSAHTNVSQTNRVFLKLTVVKYKNFGVNVPETFI